MNRGRLSHLAPLVFASTLGCSHFVLITAHDCTAGEQCRSDPNDEETWVSSEVIEPADGETVVTAIDFASVRQLNNERRFWMRRLFRDRTDGVIQTRTHYILDCDRETFTADLNEVFYWDARSVVLQPERPPLPTRAGTAARRIQDLFCDDQSLAKVRATVKTVRAIRRGRAGWADLAADHIAVLEFTSERH